MCCTMYMYIYRYLHVLIVFFAMRKKYKKYIFNFPLYINPLRQVGFQELQRMLASPDPRSGSRRRETFSRLSKIQYVYIYIYKFVLICTHPLYLKNAQAGGKFWHSSADATLNLWNAFLSHLKRKSRVIFGLFPAGKNNNKKEKGEET